MISAKCSKQERIVQYKRSNILLKQIDVKIDDVMLQKDT